MAENHHSDSSGNPQLWLITGCFGLGLIVGFMTGMSVSPTVTTVMGLIFAFAGGSVVAVIKKDIGSQELALKGKCLSALAVAIALGVIVGVMARANDWLYFKAPAGAIPFYQLQGTLTVNDIIGLYGRNKANSPVKLDPNILLILLQAQEKNKAVPVEITKQDIVKLKQAGIPASIFRMMLLGDQLEQSSGDSRTKLYVEQKPKDTNGSILDQLEKN